MSSNDFAERYQRQLLIPEVGEKGQLLLAQKRVVVVGAGGLGCTLLPLLVGSGVGHITICDDDLVALLGNFFDGFFGEVRQIAVRIQQGSVQIHSDYFFCHVSLFSVIIQTIITEFSVNNTTYVIMVL